MSFGRNKLFIGFLINDSIVKERDVSLTCHLNFESCILFEESDHDLIFKGCLFAADHDFHLLLVVF